MVTASPHSNRTVAKTWYEGYRLQSEVEYEKRMKSDVSSEVRWCKRYSKMVKSGVKSKVRWHIEANGRWNRRAEMLWRGGVRWV